MRPLGGMTFVPAAVAAAWLIILQLVGLLS